MLRKHERIWSGQLGESNVTEMVIDLIPYSNPFRSPPFNPRPKTRQLKHKEINNQLKAGFIEQAMSEWAAPIFFASKRDGKLRSCLYYRK